MKDFKEDQLEAKNWPTYLSAYILSKAAMHAYMRILAKTHPFLMINCVCPGYVKTNSHTGLLTVEEGASSPKAAKLKWGHHLMTQTYSLGEECLEINYYRAKRKIGALIPLLDFSDSPRIVNVSSSSVKLKVASYFAIHAKI
ncbi:hypothetical protein HYC85_009251 [Camellia sinensis]|uniref:Uncharacterized protein n=1 Tax=Camellia sinensis TaxID=4442 RepID=A0A7J7HFP3_CAMSI|nr:hypothetical protein HYC85_009251 [Camellia sinensis]